MERASDLMVSDISDVTGVVPSISMLNLGSGTQSAYEVQGNSNRQYNAQTINFQSSDGESVSSSGWAQANEELGAGSKPEPFVPISTVPFERDSGFIDRPELKQLEETILAGARRVALVGLGGVGQVGCRLCPILLLTTTRKSQLAIEYCYRLRDADRRSSTFWIHASSASRYAEGIRRMANDVGAVRYDDTKSNAVLAVYDWLRDTSHGRWALVLDNLDEGKILLGKPESYGDQSTRAHERKLRDYLPICDHGVVIVTSRSRSVAATVVDEVNTVQVDPMTELAAVALFRSKVGSADDTSPATMASAIVRELDRMPLAIAQAGAYIRKRGPRCSETDYLKKLTGSDRSRDRLLSTPSKELRRDDEAEDSILKTWHISFRYIQEERPSAVELLSVMSFYNHQSLSEGLLRPGKAVTANEIAGVRGDSVSEVGRSFDLNKTSDTETDEGEDFELDIEILRSYCFLNVGSDAKHFVMHSTVQASTQLWMHSQGSWSRWARESVARLNHQMPEGNFENRLQSQAYYPHARRLSHLQLRADDALLEQASVMLKAAEFAELQGYVIEAEELAIRSFDTRRRLLGALAPETLASRAQIVTVLSYRGKYEEAELHAREVLEARQQTLGDDHNETLESATELAEVLMHRERYAESEQIHRRALSARKSQMGSDDPRTLSTMNDLALVLGYRGDFVKAEELLTRALVSQEKLLVEDHPQLLRTSSNLASMLMEQGKFPEAEARLRRTRTLRERSLGTLHPDTLLCVSLLASVLLGTGEYEEAEHLARTALQGRIQALGEEHDETLISMGKLALVLWYRGKLEEAEVQCRRTLSLREKVSGSLHRETLASVQNLAGLMDHRGCHDEAVLLYERASSGLAITLGTDHPYTVRCKEQYAQFLSEKEESSQYIVVQGSCK